MRFAVACLRRDGRLVFIHRRERADEIADLLAASDCRPRIVPLIARPGRAPKRVLISAAKANKGAPTWSEPLIVHGASGAYSAQFENVLRHGHALPI